MKKLLLLAVLCLGVRVCAQVSPFQKGDRVAFVGNSITDGGHYHSYIWLYYMTRFPERRMWMANKGIGGDQASDILYRMEDDVLRWKPTVITLSFGMNDTGYFEHNGDNASAFADGKVQESRVNFLAIERLLKEKAPAARKVMVGSSPFDQTACISSTIYRRKNDAMQRVVCFQDSAAKANGWDFVDFNAPMTALNEQRQRADSTFTLCGTDRIHPDNDGHMEMAAIFLEAQGLKGLPVADVSIDAASCKVLKSERCRVGALKVARDGVLSFTYHAESLPLPLDTISHGWGFSRSQSQVVDALPDFIERFNN